MWSMQSKCSTAFNGCLLHCIFLLTEPFSFPFFFLTKVTRASPSPCPLFSLSLPLFAEPLHVPAHAWHPCRQIPMPSPPHSMKMPLQALPITKSPAMSHVSLSYCGIRPSHHICSILVCHYGATAFAPQAFWLENNHENAPLAPPGAGAAQLT